MAILCSIEVLSLIMSNESNVCVLMSNLTMKLLCVAFIIQYSIHSWKPEELVLMADSNVSAVFYSQ